MEPTLYRITVRGRLTARLAGAFPRMRIEERPGATELVGTIADCSHLYGVLDRLRDLGIQVTRLESEPTPTARRRSVTP